VQAVSDLTISGVVIEGEVATINGEVYEFDANNSYGTNKRVNISAAMVQSQGTLTLGGAIPANNETMVVGATTYTWKTTLTGAANEILRGATIDDCVDNFVYAINAGIGAGILYGTGTTANASVTAAKSSGTEAILTAKVYGTVGDAIVTTETMGDIANIFDAGTLGTTTAGVDCPLADAATALISAFNAQTALALTASDGGAGVVTLTANAAGALDGSAGNAVTTTKTMANGAWTSTVMAGGSDATADEAVAALVIAITGDSSAVVTAADGTGSTVDLTAKVKGTGGNLIALAETLGLGTVSGSYLTGRTDEGSADAATALISAINGDTSAVVTAATAGSGAMTVTAKVKGVIGNSIAISKTTANGAWAGGASILAGGVDGTVGASNEIYADTSYLYLAIAANTIADANWRRVSLGSAY
jgi:hypothetical protein